MVGINISLRYGVVLLSFSSILLLFLLGTWALSQPANSEPVNLFMLMLVIPLVGLLMGFCFLLNGVLTQKRQVLLGETEFTGEPDKLPQKPTRDYWPYFYTIIILGGLFAFCFLEARSLWLRSQLPQSGVHTTGIVIEHRFRQRKYGGYYFITSQYDAVDSFGETQTFTQEHFCTEEQYQSFPDGSEIPIIHLPQNPKVSDISGNEAKLIKGMWERDTTRRLLIFVGGPLLTLVTIQSIRRNSSSKKKSE